MALSWRQNVIMSHGGKHGPGSKTYHKGTTVPPKAARVIPDSILGQSTVPIPGPDPRAPTVSKVPTPTKPEPQDDSGPPDPATKSELYSLKKAVIEALAEKHGIHIDPDTKGRTNLLKKRLVDAIGL